MEEEERAQKKHHVHNIKYNIDELIKIRHEFHKYPELQFKEFETQKRIKQFLLKKGIPQESFKPCATTGYTIDIFGKAEPKNIKKLIALRAEMDALEMPEHNHHLSYRSTNNAQHACGHDGHMATLLGFICKFLEIQDKVPSNRGVRILFQPSEEGPQSGALQMIKEGCLDQVDECYGYHNWPTHPVGYLLVKEGAQMAAVSDIEIKFIGKGGHGSKPECAIDPVQMSVDFHLKFRKLMNETFKDRKCLSTFPLLKGGTRVNVIASEATIGGTLRSLENDIPDLYKEEIIKILDEIKEEYPGSDYDLKFTGKRFDQLDNTPKETNIIKNLGKEYFGEKRVGEFDTIPVYASEDFSFYLRKVPGVFFFLGSGKEFDDTMVHDNKYDFNDDLIDIGSDFFMNIVKNRLELEL
ncbi:Peptidase M20, dimerization domain [Pseudocohnilembus persalinus]|uniref:Peptidase M20, dimerization domain n=1 Tax=Pseudocohnilembus persalinus TaxID=266149 RepID=A0A0V0R1Q3_PSEPJ|nr:Peptidase M20, dimerization domain [Pseudocohnilembus persalinus]|eukprot:KRX08427.1 Peptidase M20, dimerization domain [Pseudocohnilembus persalinus]